MTEIFKAKTGIAQELMKGVFEFTDVPYNLRNLSKCNRSRMASVTSKLWSKTMGQGSHRNEKFQIS